MILEAKPMAKRAPGKKTTKSNQLRRGRKNISEIREYADDLRGLAAEMDTVAANMETQGTSEMAVDGVMKYDNARKLVIGFIANLNSSLAKARMGEG